MIFERTTGLPRTTILKRKGKLDRRCIRQSLFHLLFRVFPQAHITRAEPQRPLDVLDPLRTELKGPPEKNIQHLSRPRKQATDGADGLEREARIVRLDEPARAGREARDGRKRRAPDVARVSGHQEGVHAAAEADQPHQIPRREVLAYLVWWSISM